jgi:hypothetical protein
MSVDEIQVHCEVRSLDAVSSDAGPDSVALDPPGTIGCGHTREKRTIKASIDDVA